MTPRPSRAVAALALLALLLLVRAEAPACTLWSLSGQEVAGGGAILVKNRDFTPDHPNHFALVTPRQGYRLAAMVSVNPEGRSQVVGGVNEKGLAIVTATVGTLPRDERRARISERGLESAARAILARYASVDEVLADREGQARLAPVFALLADARRTAVLESSGTACVVEPLPADRSGAHTNHPLLPGAPGDIRLRPDARGSVARLGRIRELLAQAPKPLGLDAAAAYARDAVAGPDESIFRTGSAPGKPRTLGMLAVWLPPGRREGPRADRAREQPRGAGGGAPLRAGPGLLAGRSGPGQVAPAPGRAARPGRRAGPGRALTRGREPSGPQNAPLAGRAGPHGPSWTTQLSWIVRFFCESLRPYAPPRH